MKTSICPLCSNDYKQRRITSHTAICGHWNWQQLRRSLFVLAFFVILGFLLYQFGLFDDGMTRFKRELQGAHSLNAVQSTLSLCPKGNENTCRILIYSQLLKINPTSPDYKAKLAMALTFRKEFQKAKPLYEELIRIGFINYDLFAALGKNQEGLGEFEAAAESYSNALALAPSLVEVAQNLSRVLIKLNRPTEALSLLESFVDQFQGSQKYLQAQVDKVRKLVNENLTHSDQSSLRLMTLVGRSHYLPIQASDQNKIKAFLINAELTHLTMSTDSLRHISQEALQKALPISMILANGQRVNGFITKIPELQIGPWKLKNISAYFCDLCNNEIGQSVLQNFSTRAIAKKGIEILEIWKI